ncbi:hypothetical protein DL764_004244 [Monosporascus ibericus]|uniref:Uncharacterized protein n=1 Tax=Monosporascus ibericus TaxID=155417 RepID=A0A4Q4TDH9_9PEZI|nr:hypothetical protein DL764_004244 [Monosporascus ibericus]
MSSSKQPASKKTFQLTNDKIELTSTLEETREQLEAQRVELARQASMEQPDQPDQPLDMATPSFNWLRRSIRDKRH